MDDTEDLSLFLRVGVAMYMLEAEESGAQGGQHQARGGDVDHELVEIDAAGSEDGLAVLVRQRSGACDVGGARYASLRDVEGPLHHEHGIGRCHVGQRRGREGENVPGDEQGHGSESWEDFNRV